VIKIAYSSENQNKIIEERDDYLEDIRESMDNDDIDYEIVSEEE